MKKNNIEFKIDDLVIMNDVALEFLMQKFKVRKKI
jgi:hypothetical protein